MIVDSPKMRKRLEDTYKLYRRRPKEALPRLKHVFDDNEDKVMAFVKAVNNKEDWREAIGH